MERNILIEALFFYHNVNNINNMSMICNINKNLACTKFNQERKKKYRDDFMHNEFSFGCNTFYSLYN